MFGLKVTGDPGATVGLVAVDKGVYVLNNKHHLNQKKVIALSLKIFDRGLSSSFELLSKSILFGSNYMQASDANEALYPVSP